MDETGLRLVYRFLDYDLNENALFLLDRLHAFAPDNATWIHLRALCCLRLGRFLAACEYSRDRAITGEHIGCSYVFSQACLQLGRYRDGISSLEKAQRLGTWTSHEAIEVTDNERFIPDAPAVSCLLGKLHRANGDIQSAANSFVTSLEVDAFMWDAFTNLCASGIALRVSNIFRPKTSSLRPPPNRSLVVSTKVNSGPQTQFHDGEENMVDVAGPLSMDVFGAADKASSRTVVELPAKRKQGPTLDGFATSAIGMRTGSGRMEATQPSIMRQRRSTRLHQSTNGTRADSTEYHDIVHGLKRSEKPRMVANTVPPRKITPDRKPSGTKPGPVPQASRDQKQRSSVKATRAVGSNRPPGFLPSAAPKERHSELFYELFLKFGTAYYQLKQFQPRACLSTLTSLPVEQQATPWVISKTARSQYEMLSYEDSKSTFQVLRKVAPSWMEDLEVYSTVLWHLKMDALLAFHSHDLADNHYSSPQAWCAVGNSFSLQKSHDEAIRAFRRATQLEPQLPHAYSLLGYEHYDLEEYDKATIAFRRAIQIDARHYVAWVGLGKVHEALGTHERALKYYLQAEKINPENMVILANIARIFDKLGNPRQGLTYLQRSNIAQAGQLSAFVKLQAAKLFLRLNQPNDAVCELSSARDLIPEEPEVHFLLGQAYRLSGEAYRSEALKCFTVALSLRPWSQAIKDAMSSMEEQP